MELPRVTEILKPFSNIEYIKPDILKNAAARGTLVHGYCAAIAKDAWLPESMIDQELKGYVKSFNLWKDAQVLKFPIVEKRFQDDKAGFTGQLDMVILGTDKELYLVDLKTSARPQKTHPIQMAAYKHLLLLNNVRVKAAILVYLHKDGDFPEILRFDNLENETQVFFNALDCYKFFNRKKGQPYEHYRYNFEEYLSADSRHHGGTELHPERLQDGQ